LEEIKQDLVYHLIRKRCFEDARYKKKWLVIVDGTQLYCGRRKLNEHCLERCSNKGTDKEITLYHRDVLEAKIYFGEKLVASIGSEFIENNGEDRKRQEGMNAEEIKQDCETKAFFRLAERIKKRFPRLPIGVRYIAIMDNIDTAKGISDLVPMQDLFNEWHAKNTSDKVRKVMQSKGMSGKPLTTNPPFGYMKNPDNKDEWIVDEPAAKIVRKIFDLCVSGLGPTQIAKRLKAEKVLTPTEYWNSIGRKCGKPPERSFNWCSATVSDILAKQEYCG